MTLLTDHTISDSVVLRQTMLGFYKLEWLQNLQTIRIGEWFVSGMMLLVDLRWVTSHHHNTNNINNNTCWFVRFTNRKETNIWRYKVYGDVIPWFWVTWEITGSGKEYTGLVIRALDKSNIIYSYIMIYITWTKDNWHPHLETDLPGGTHELPD